MHNDANLHKLNTQYHPLRVATRLDARSHTFAIMESMRAYNAQIRTPFRMILAGSSGSGKTIWVYQFLRYHKLLLDKAPAKIIFYYSAWQPVYDTLNESALVSEFIKGVPSEEDISSLLEYAETGGSLVIIDDQALNLNKDMAKIFTVTSRHSNVSIMLLAQNIFTKQPFFRDISLQATYIVLFKNPRDKTAIRYLSQQVMPNNSQFLIAACEHAHAKPYSYFLIDLDQKTKDAIRFRTNIFPHENPITVYIPK